MYRFDRGLLTSVALCALLFACSKSADNTQPTDKDKNMMQMADTFKQGGHLNEAATVYAELASRSTTSVDSHLEAASLYRQLGQPQDAIVILQKAHELQPKNTRVLTALGYAQLSAKRYDASITTFDQWVQIEPNNPAPYNGKAIATDNAGYHKEAQALYRNALALNPSNEADVQNNLAMSMILNNQLGDAIGVLEPLVKRPGANKTMRQNLALAYGLKGDEKRALELNMQDLPEAQAKENMRFYKHYKKQMKKPSADKEALPATVEEVPTGSTVSAPKKVAAKTATPAPEKLAEKIAEKPVEKPAPKAAPASEAVPEAVAKNRVQPPKHKVEPQEAEAPQPSTDRPAQNTLNTTRPAVNTAYPSGR